MQKNFLDLNCLNAQELIEILELSENIYNNPEKYIKACENKILAALFYEPSTRTKFSFQAAMLKLGGNIIGFSGTAESSVSKGESLRDTIKIVSGYADVIAIRHQKDGAAFAAAQYSGKVPIINAGDGKHFHPTQTLLDLLSIKKFKNRFSNLNIGLCGDLLNGRTVHSLLCAFELFDNNNFYLISQDNFKLPEKYLVKLREKNNKIFVFDKIVDCISELDIIYMTRLQRERIEDGKGLNKIKEDLILDNKKLSLAKKDLAILHPLPKNEEIADEVDDDSRALYFKQAELGLYARMALLIKLLNCDCNNYNINLNLNENNNSCKNPDCITQDEKYIKKLFNKDNTCAYCDK